MKFDRCYSLISATVKSIPKAIGFLVHFSRFYVGARRSLWDFYRGHCPFLRSLTSVRLIPSYMWEKETKFSRKNSVSVVLIIRSLNRYPPCSISHRGIMSFKTEARRFFAEGSSGHHVHLASQHLLQVLSESNKIEETGAIIEIHQ